MSYPDAAEILRERLAGNLLDPLIAALGVNQPAMRVALAAAHLLGVALLCDLMAVLRDTPVTQLADVIAPELQRLLTGDL